MKRRATNAVGVTLLLECDTNSTMTIHTTSTPSNEALEAKACHILEESTLPVQERVSRFESLLGGEAAVENALVTVSTAGKQHVLIDDHHRFADLERYCERLSGSYDITLKRTLTRTLATGVSTKSLRSSIESAEHLSAGQVDHRLALPTSIEHTSPYRLDDQSRGEEPV